MRFWVGGYTAESDGRADGIATLTAGDADSGWASGVLSAGDRAAAAAGSPSWLAAHPFADVVYAALESDGNVQAFRRVGETTLEKLGSPVAAGAAVCHVAVSPDGRLLVASAWGDGTVTVIRLGADGALGASTVAPAEEAAPTDSTFGVGDDILGLPDARSHVSRAHQAVFLPGGTVATIDLGRDLVRMWSGTGSGLRPSGEVALPIGTGPRHAIWHPSGHLYVLTEHSNEVFVLAPAPGGAWRIVSGVPLLGGETSDAGAEIAVSRDGETVYAGLRGSDTVAVLRVRGAGETLMQTALVDSGTRWPRHHLVIRDTLLVAGQHADEIVSLPLDERSGIPGRARWRVAVPSPSVLLPAARA